MTTPAEVMMSHGERLLAAQRLSASALCFTKARELQRAHRRETAAPDLGLARVRLAERKLEEARGLIDALTSRYPAEGEAVMLRGVLEEHRGNLAAALPHYTEAARRTPKSAVVRYNLGRALARTRRWQEALPELQAAVDLEPSSAAYLYTLATALQAAGRTPEALEVLGRCVEKAPDFLDGYITLADLLVYVQRDDVADQLLEAAAARFPGAGVLHSKRAAICARRNDIEGTIGHLERQAEADPESEEPWLGIAVYRLMLLQFEPAEAAAKRALQLNPKSGRARYQLGVIYDACRLKDLAKQQFREAIRAAPDFWRPYNNLGTLLLEEKARPQTEEAARLFEGARDRARGLERLAPTFNLALAYWNLGRKADSQRCAREAAAGPADHRVAQDARRFLANF